MEIQNKTVQDNLFYLPHTKNFIQRYSFLSESILKSGKNEKTKKIKYSNWIFKKNHVELSKIEFFFEIFWCELKKNRKKKKSEL